MKSYFSALTVMLFYSVAFTSTLNQWVDTEYRTALQKMYMNISPADSARGVVIASPSRQDPDYYFHWVRDSALVVDSLITIQTSSPLENELLLTVDDFISLSRKIQLQWSLTGLGEPRFNTDGTPFSGPWARPQNDGPALRALTLLHILDQSVDEPRAQKISEILETDLSFIIHHHTESSFDLWEETRGDHFYTSLNQMAALKKAIRHFDPRWNFTIFDCEAARVAIELALHKYWKTGENYFAVSRNRIEGGDNKKTDLDSATILAVLHSNLDDEEFFSVRDSRILATAEKIENIFLKIYPINQENSDELAPAIGRYEDDVYFGGNPWYLNTLAYAELHYRLAVSLRKNPNWLVNELSLSFLQKAWGSGSEVLRSGMNLKNEPMITRALIAALKNRGDRFVARVKLHTPADGSLSEQFSQHNGYAVSARDLTWSYASFLTAVHYRDLIK